MDITHSSRQESRFGFSYLSLYFILGRKGLTRLEGLGAMLST
jgi:hypothetical protein